MMEITLIWTNEREYWEERRVMPFSYDEASSTLIWDLSFSWVAYTLTDGDAAINLNSKSQNYKLELKYSLFNTNHWLGRT